ncbi:MAG: hypothetical protein AAGB31_16745, partial [Bdellovibrio sp.]
MSFKKKRSLLVLSLIAISSFSGVGCSEFINGKKAEPEVLEFSEKRFACLQKLPEQLKKFSVGEASEQEIRGGYDCLREALKYFNKRTFGSIEGAYTGEEMRNFFGKYFLKKNNVTSEFTAELMKIKQALLGGSDLSITKIEIHRLVEILGVLRDESVLLSPHMKILLSQAQQQKAGWPAISAAVEQLRKSFQKLLSQTDLAKSRYSFADLKKALKGFSEFARGKEPFAPYDNSVQWMVLLEPVKTILMGEKAHFQDEEQWRKSLDSLVDLYELVLKYRESVQELKIQNPDNLDQIGRLLDQGLKLIQNSHQMKTKGFIPFEDLDHLLASLPAEWRGAVRVESLQKAYRIFLMRILDPDRKNDT